MRPSTFQLEVSEATLMDPRSPDPEQLLRRLHALGVRLAIDNFGTGSSSLSCLRQLPLDVLNIDRRFIAGLGSSRDDEVIVRAVLNLADAFAVDAVAEGVETEAAARRGSPTPAADWRRATCSRGPSTPRLPRRCCASRSRRVR